MRQFVKLNDLQDEFKALGVGIAGMTYDKPEIIQAFCEKWEINYPILKDVERQHVDAWGIRNQEYGPGSFGYGIPYPGVVLIAPDGKILAKWAEEGYRSRADWSEVLADVTTLVGDS
ncbi:MAG: redoxin domain-containing protein [Pseudomonadota bacterium]